MMNETLNRADEAQDLLNLLVQKIIPFIRQADKSAAALASGNGTTKESEATNIVEYHPPEELHTLLKRSLEASEKGTGREGLSNLIDVMLKYSVNTWSNGFMDKLYASTNPIGLVSELLLAALNTNVHVYSVSPVLALIEKQTTRDLARLFGFTSPHAGGIAQPGGSAANQTSLIIARNILHPKTKKEGIGSQHFTLFTSADGHYSLEKGAQIQGYGSDAVIPVPVDEEGRMIPSELDKAITYSRHRGEIPLYVNATAGTTVLGAYDPLTEISAVCKKHNLWLHVDASWGGSVVFSDTYRSRLNGSGLADSIGWTCHKMLGVPLTCAFLLGRDMRQFHAALTLRAGYLFHDTITDEDEATSNPLNPPTSSIDEEVWDLAELTPQCGRKGDAMKLFLGWQYYGTAGYGAKVDRAFAGASHLANAVAKNPDFVLLSAVPTPCVQVCFAYAPGGKRLPTKRENDRLTQLISRALVPRGFMIDYAPGAQGAFFRVVVNGQSLRGTLDGMLIAMAEEGRKVVGAANGVNGVEKA